MALVVLFASALWVTPLTGATAVVPGVLSEALNVTQDVPLPPSDPRGLSGGGARHRRAVSSTDVHALLDYHNRVRSQVFPPAANMEFMLWDEGLAKSADSWASRCLWEHGPKHVMRYLGQNLSVTTGRYQSITDLVRPWYEERHHFSFPNRCTGAVCSHYTQMVWASTNRVGCAVRKCSHMKVFGRTWREATLLVCNYSIKGNWVGEAPYKTGRPCSMCPTTYGGSCLRNQCSPNARRTHRH